MDHDVKLVYEIMEKIKVMNRENFQVHLHSNIYEHISCRYCYFLFFKIGVDSPPGAESRIALDPDLLFGRR